MNKRSMIIVLAVFILLSGAFVVATITPSEDFDFRGIRSLFNVKNATIYNATIFGTLQSDFNITLGGNEVCTAANGLCGTASEFNYNQTIPALEYTDEQIAAVNTTGNIQGLLNDTGIYSTFNTTYDSFAYNQTVPALAYTDTQIALVNFTNGTGLSLVGTEFNHSDTSSQGDSENSGNTFIQDITFDTFGHVLSIVTGVVDFSDVWTAISGNRTESESNLRSDIDANITALRIYTSIITDSGTAAADNHTDILSLLGSGSVSTSASADTITLTGVDTNRSDTEIIDVINGSDVIVNCDNINFSGTIGSAGICDGDDSAGGGSFELNFTTDSGEGVIFNSEVMNFTGDGGIVTSGGGNTIVINGSSLLDQTQADTLYAGIEWDYNQTIPALEYTDEQIGLINTTANIQLLLNDTGIYSTFNSTYAIWAHNQTIPANAYTDTQIATVTYINGSGISLVGLEFNHSDTSSQADSDNSGNTFIQDIILDTFGHITSIVVSVVDFSDVWTAISGNRTEVDADIASVNTTANIQDLFNDANHDNEASNFTTTGTGFFGELEINGKVNITGANNLTLGDTETHWNGSCLNTIVSGTLVQSIGCA